jgi:hypothetical protein
MKPGAVNPGVTTALRLDYPHQGRQIKRNCFVLSVNDDQNDRVELATGALSI